MFTETKWKHLSEWRSEVAVIRTLYFGGAAFELGAADLRT
jgi:hypothetical protein